MVGCESFPLGREKEILELAYALEIQVAAPLARAIVRHAKAAGISAAEIDDFQSISGQGLTGSLDGSTAAPRAGGSFSSTAPWPGGQKSFLRPPPN